MCLLWLKIVLKVDSFLILINFDYQALKVQADEVEVFFDDSDPV